MTAKERIKCEEKGISTITQLSYGYRPRRRRRIKPAPPASNPPTKPDHKLKALAIKKAQIHVVGSPSLPIEGHARFHRGRRYARPQLLLAPHCKENHQK